MVEKSTRLQVIPLQSTQNTANLPSQTYEKNQWTFLFNTGVNFSLRNNFANSGSVAKVSVPVHNYNSLKKLTYSSELHPSHTPHATNDKATSTFLCYKNKP